MTPAQKQNNKNNNQAAYNTGGQNDDREWNHDAKEDDETTSSSSSGSDSSSSGSNSRAGSCGSSPWMFGGLSLGACLILIVSVIGIIVCVQNDMCTSDKQPVIEGSDVRKAPSGALDQETDVDLSNAPDLGKNPPKIEDSGVREKSKSEEKIQRVRNDSRQTLKLVDCSPGWAIPGCNTIKLYNEEMENSLWFGTVLNLIPIRGLTSAQEKDSGKLFEKQLFGPSSANSGQYYLNILAYQAEKWLLNPDWRQHNLILLTKVFVDQIGTHEGSVLTIVLPHIFVHDKKYEQVLSKFLALGKSAGITVKFVVAPIHTDTSKMEVFESEDHGSVKKNNWYRVEKIPVGYLPN